MLVLDYWPWGLNGVLAANSGAVTVCGDLVERRHVRRRCSMHHAAHTVHHAAHVTGGLIA